MRVTVVHGYFLHDSGSGVYVRELVHALVALGHDVTLVCQEHEPEKYDFIDSAYSLDAGNTTLSRIRSGARLYPGSCRLVRPDLRGRLLVYVAGPFPGFARQNVAAFQDAPTAELDRYIDANVSALRTTFAAWPPELVLAQHLIMQPVLVRRALAGVAPYVVTEHGSALNFSVRVCDALVPLALEGLGEAAAVATVSEGARADLVGWAGEHGLDIADRTVAMPPGVDIDRFTPSGDRTAAIAEMARHVAFPAGFDVRPDDDVLVFTGGLRNTKGVQHAVAALPLIAAARGRRLRLLVCGDGPARGPLEELSRVTASGDAVMARALVAVREQLASPAEWGDVVADAPPIPDGASVVFLGHLDHEQLASVLAVADVALVPSVFPEAAALVNSEALASGALPLASYHSGMAALDDSLAAALHDDVFVSLVAGRNHTRALADAAVHVLTTYPTRDPAFRMTVHEIAVELYPTWRGTAAAYLKMACTKPSRPA
jgi:glycosyltransferase involved in cell wall biosynthesis